MNKICAEIHGDVEKFKKIVSESNGTGEICRKYNFCDNGKSRNQIKEFISRFDLDISHFGQKNHPRKYELVEKECPICKNKFTTQLNHPREKKTCSHKCGNVFFKRNHTEEEKNKIREGIKNYYVSIGKKLVSNDDSVLNTNKKSIKRKLAYSPKVLINKKCEFCNTDFIARFRKNQKFCSNKCSATFTHSNPEYRKKLRDSVQKRISNGTHNGWNSRNIVSYPEKFFMTVLNNNNISYQHNKKVGKYFIDFAITEKMVALEIDGKQHLIEDRQKSDSLKDTFLKNNGWIVYRIPWKSINNDLGKKYILDEINKFLIFMGSLSIKVNPLKETC